jgi:hypothetical protein
MIDELSMFDLLPKLHERNMFILIDALDEIPLGTSRNQVIAFLDELASRHISHLHILATGRLESDISLGLKSWDPPLLIGKSKVIEDMRLFVTSEMENDVELASKPVSTKEKIIHRLVDEGDGM